jgi:L-fucose isomerase-like protein
MLQRANYNQSPTFLAEFTVRHPENDNGILLWHGSAPFSMKHPGGKIKIGHHWILPSPLSGMVHLKLQNGPVTVARFDGDKGQYQLALGQGRAIEGPDTLNSYVWMEVDNWPRWERIIMEGPFIHHVAMMYGNQAKALVEACKYIPHLESVILNEHL